MRKNNDKKCEICIITCKYIDCFLEYTNFKHDLTEYKCLCCNKNYQKFSWQVKGANFTNLLTRIIMSLFFCCEMIFILINILMIWTNFIKNHLKKKDFHSHLNMKDICNAHYRHSKRVYKEVEIKHLR